LRLTNIKISGFKSFVDKTEISLSEKRTAIVGPNGCGKSNIIDAVKWVLGETSKHIRGDNIGDVIFNGTDSRKPHDYANVELLFSNTENRIGGQYAEYDEISVKREVTRDGTSKYFLNNSHCRRRDILDIFMGTGLGPKSYAIINQGTASKLIESKPEEFRVYLEEVAGISKYRERKRETENKIKHTKENLERLSDVINEVSKQLKTLERQAIQADKYKKLEDEKRSIKAEIIAISIRDFQEQIENNNKKIEVKKTKIEKKMSDISTINIDIDKNKSEYQELNEKMNAIQKEYYDALSEVGRTEQAIEYEKDGAERDKEQYENAIQTIEKYRERLKNDTDEILSIKQQIESLESEHSQKNASIIDLDKEKELLESDLLDEQEKYEENLKNSYGFKQIKSNKQEKVDLLEIEIKSSRKEIEESQRTSNDILTELKKIESFELKEKINYFNQEIQNYHSLLKNYKDGDIIIKNSEKIKNILEDIKRIIESVQKNELEIAKKNSKIKEDIDNKILSKSEKISKDLNDIEKIKDDISNIEIKVKEIEKIIISLNNSVESIKIKIDEVEDLISDAREDLHNTEVGIETKKVEMHSLQNNIDLNNNELAQLTGNIENLKVRSDKPDLKLSELEKILSEHLKIQHVF